MTKVNVDKAIDFVLASGDPILSALALFAAGIDPGDLISIAYASLLTGDVAADLRELALKGVLGNQMDDGGWTTNYGDQYRNIFTVDALFLLKRFPSVQALTAAN